MITKATLMEIWELESSRLPIRGHPLEELIEMVSSSRLGTAKSALTITAKKYIIAA